jgi:hypothetical protein
MHECPTCGMFCHCSGDIDDILIPDSQAEANCICCPDDAQDDEDDDEWFDDPRYNPVAFVWQPNSPDEPYFIKSIGDDGDDDLPF